MIELTENRRQFAFLPFCGKGFFGYGFSVVVILAAAFSFLFFVAPPAQAGWAYQGRVNSELGTSANGPEQIWKYWEFFRDTGAFSEYHFGGYQDSLTCTNVLGGVATECASVCRILDPDNGSCLAWDQVCKCDCSKSPNCIGSFRDSWGYGIVKTDYFVNFIAPDETDHFGVFYPGAFLSAYANDRLDFNFWQDGGSVSINKGAGGTYTSGRGCGLDNTAPCKFFYIYHWLPVPPPPINPSGSCPIPGNSATVSWSSAPGAAFYALRVNNQSDGWIGNCVGAAPGDFCQDIYGTSLSFPTTAGASYNWWVHSVNALNEASDGAAGGSFTCNALPPTAAITANGSVGSILINQGSAATIAWTSTNAGSCVVLPPGWTGISGSQSTGNLAVSQNYNLSCIGIGGSAADSVTVNVNQAPKASNLSLSHDDFCNLNGISYWFSWQYFDADNDRQNNSTIQIAADAGFNNLVVDRQFIGNSLPVVLSENPVGAQLGYNKIYYWRVKVQDEHGFDSVWAYPSPVSFKTPDHAYPNAKFSGWQPASPSAGELVNFFASAQPAGVVPSWLWQFDNGIPTISSLQNPQVKFRNDGVHQVTLWVGDAPPHAAYHCEYKTNIKVKLPLPVWQEIAP